MNSAEGVAIGNGELVAIVTAGGMAMMLSAILKPIGILGFFSHFLESDFDEIKSNNLKGLSAGTTPNQRRNFNSLSN